MPVGGKGEGIGICDQLRLTYPTIYWGVNIETDEEGDDGTEGRKATAGI